jgi:hypothetical protein
VVISWEVTNRGKRAGDEVVQHFIRDEIASVTRPVKEPKRLQVGAPGACGLLVPFLQVAGSGFEPETTGL